MNEEEMKQEFAALYDMMANSNNIAYMRIFGGVYKEIMGWLIKNKPDLAQEWILQLGAIRWSNYLTPKEADRIVVNMKPQAQWTRDQWKVEMSKHDLPLEYQPKYNQCALYVEMNKIMSDQGETIAKYIDKDNVFKFVYEMAVNNLTDKDGVYNIRSYFGL